MTKEMTSTPPLTLGDVVTFQRGFDITKDEQSPGLYPVIASSGANSTNDTFMQEGPGVVIGRKGSLGGVFWSEGPYWPHDTTLWVKDFKNNDPKFIYYWLKTLGLEYFDSGSSNPTLNRNHVHLLPVTLPDKRTQILIAQHLAVFDDVIENNRQRIELLKETLFLLYQEWFVNFRYPGHEDVELVDSKIGLLPDGWTWLPLSDCPFDLTKPRIEPYEESKIYLATSDVHDLHHVDGGEEIEFSLLPSRAQHSPVPNTVWFARMANYQKILFFMPDDQTLDELVLSSGFACISCPHPWFGFVVAQVVDPLFEDRKEQFATGSTQVSLSDAGAQLMPWLVPKEEVVHQFGKMIEPVLKTVANLRFMNRSLIESRHFFLLRLISGELEVSDLELAD